MYKKGHKNGYHWPLRNVDDSDYNPAHFDDDDSPIQIDFDAWVLYDLFDDINETKDLASSKPGIVQYLKTRYEHLKQGRVSNGVDNLPTTHGASQDAIVNKREEPIVTKGNEEQISGNRCPETKYAMYPWWNDASDLAR